MINIEPNWIVKTGHYMTEVAQKEALNKMGRHINRGREMMWEHEPRKLLLRALLLDWLGQLLILAAILVGADLLAVPAGRLSQLEDQGLWLIFCLLVYPLLGWLFGSYTVLRWRTYSWSISTTISDNSNCHSDGGSNCKMVSKPKRRNMAYLQKSTGDMAEYAYYLVANCPHRPA